MVSPARLGFRMDRNSLSKAAARGSIVNLVVGLVGGVLGGWLFSFFGLVPARHAGQPGPRSVIGAVVLLWIAAA